MIKKSARFNYIILIYLAGIAVFTLFRLVETVAYCDTTDGPDDFAGLYPRALLMGLRFDTVVSCYMLALPLVMIIVGELARIRKGWYYNIAHYITMVLYTICFFACATDIPYFCYFFNRLDMVALTWADDFGTSASMIVHEPMYVLYLAMFVAVTVGWWILGHFIFKHTAGSHRQPAGLPYGWAIGLSVLLLGMWFCGQRGTVTAPRPVRVSTAYFSANPFINQIGLNPVFTFFKSWQESTKSTNQTFSLIDLDTARQVLEEERAAGSGQETTGSGLRLPEGTNVVLVLMESMSADKTGIDWPERSQTPCLDSLMAQSLTFTETYTSGIHTYNGIYSTLYSQPSLMARHTMRHTPLERVCGLPQALSAAGYSTTFFVTHEADFDNLQGFLSLNGMQRVVDKKDYPKEEYVGVWGPPDHVLFDHMLEYCDSIADKGPFFASAMTITDHVPFAVPEDINYRFKHKQTEKRALEYADWAIGRFMRMASERPWFNNTLFVFVADHGFAMDKTYDMPLSHNHVPLLFHAPGRIAPGRNGQLALQIDVAPMILGMLGIDAPHNMLGINILEHPRHLAFFCADDKIGVVDGEWFYLYRAKQEGRESLYRYKEHSTEDMATQMPERVTVMRRYGLGMTQIGQQMILDGSTACDR